MKRKPSKVIEFPEDCERLCRIAKQSGHHISPLEAQAIWSWHSESYAAGWMILPRDDKQIWKILQEFFELD